MSAGRRGWAMGESQVLGRTGLWRCSCGYINLEDAACMSCGLTQDGVPSREPREPAAPTADLLNSIEPRGSRRSSATGPRFVVTKAMGVVAAVLVFNLAIQLLLVNQ